MPQDIRLWEIRSGDELKSIKRSKLNIEERIESWLEKDISIISSDLLVIGRQVPTDFGGVIDLLCLERTGALVIIELKRDKTPREVTAQVLDYASWAKGLSNERVTEIANAYLGGGDDSLEEAFKRKFGEELPEIINERQQMLVVASEIDSSSERIINYLSDTYGVPINAATFQYFQGEDGKELLARAFLLEPSEVEYRTQAIASSKKKPPLSYGELQAIAENKGVGKLYRRLFEGLTDYFDQRSPTRSSVAFIGVMEGSRYTIFSLVPGKSDPGKGVFYSVYVERFLKYFEMDTEDRLAEILPPDSWKGEAWKNGPVTKSGFFGSEDAIEKLLSGLARFRERRSAG